MRPTLLLRSCLSALILCAACGGDEVDISTITNETAHQAATEVEEEAEALIGLDSVSPAKADTIKASQTTRVEVIQEALKRSPYAGLSDRSLDSLRQAWLVAYASSCDAAELERIKDVIGADEVLKQWSNDHRDSAVAYHRRLMAAKKNCAGE